MRYLIIGLGIYGANLAVDLTRQGNEVIGADKDPSLVEAIKEYISTAYILDSTDETALSVLPLTNVDLVIVAIGENFGASIRTVAILKKIGVKHIYARAIDALHQSILEGLKIDRIITPEQRAASDLVAEIAYGTGTSSLNIDSDHVVIRFPAPDSMIGAKYNELRLKQDYSLQLIAVCRPTSSTNILGISHRRPKVLDLTKDNYQVDDGDILTCYGRPADFRRLIKEDTI
ncbi:MAG: TrkA family potassium uptake protein [Bacteroides sp.]|nr:TrkA family potassium uptake protein [Bacteroides sp.]MCM1412734.1 TrkA family potassium uptake protein [Bacteroides sp.]MCM1470972.1 TrkA family potassium uptake protein [Bacteroides sp.]